MLQASLNRLMGRPVVVLLGLMLLTVLGALWGSGIAIRGDMEDLFPEDNPVVERAKRARDTVGQRSELLILIGSPDRTLNREVGAELAGRLRSETGLISAVDFKRDITFFEKNALLYLDVAQLRETHEEVSKAIAQAVMVDDFEFEEELEVDSDHGGGAASPDQKTRIPSRDEIIARYRTRDLREYFESPDGEVIAVKAYPTFKPTETGRAQELNSLVQDLIGRSKAVPGRGGLEITVEGEYSRLAETVNTIRSELKVATAVALGGICLILLIGFRRLRAIVFILVPLVVGIAWTLAGARASVGYLNIITAFIFAILVGLGIDFVVHGAGRIDEEQRNGKSLPEAIRAGLTKLGPAMIAAALTTMATFAVLGVFEFRGFSQFGGLAALGVFLCLLALYTTLPPLMLSVEKIRATPSTSSNASRGERFGFLDRPRMRTLAGASIYLFIGLTAWGVMSVSEVEFEADTRSWRVKRTAPSSKLASKYQKEASQRSYAPALIVTEDLEATSKVYEQLMGQKTETGLLQDVRSVYSFVPSEQEEKLAVIAEIKRKIDNKYDFLEGQTKRDADRLRIYLEPSSFTAEDLPDWLKTEFTDSKGRFGRYVLLYFRGIKSNAVHVAKIRAQFEELQVNGQIYHSTASYYILAEAYRVVKEDGPLAVGLAAGVIFFLLLLLFRRVGDVLLIFIPLVVAFLVLMGILAAAGIPLNIFNIVVLPIVFGIGVDTSIHLVHRLNEGTPLGLTLATAGRAALMSSGTTAVGFLSLLCVSNDGLQSLGLVAAIGVACAYVCSVSLFSASVLLGWKKVG